MNAKTASIPSYYPIRTHHDYSRPRFAERKPNPMRHNHSNDHALSTLSRKLTFTFEGTSHLQSLVTELVHALEQFNDAGCAASPNSSVECWSDAAYTYVEIELQTDSPLECDINVHAGCAHIRIER